MRWRRRGHGRWIALSLACLLAGCGRSESVHAPSQSPSNGEFDAAALDLDRPCTLVTAQDAAEVSGLQFYRTMAANLVGPGHVRCAQGVGAFGLHGMVELDVAFPAEGGSAQALFLRECRAPDAPPAPAPAAMAPAPAIETSGVQQAADSESPAPPPSISGRHCLARSGGFALLLEDRVLLMRVRESAGEIDAAASHRLASLVSGRLGN